MKTLVHATDVELQAIPTTAELDVKGYNYLILQAVEAGALSVTTLDGEKEIDVIKKDVIKDEKVQVPVARIAEKAKVTGNVIALLGGKDNLDEATDIGYASHIEVVEPEVIP